jgi:hypothetical protein
VPGTTHFGVPFATQTKESVPVIRWARTAGMTYKPSLAACCEYSLSIAALFKFRVCTKSSARLPARRFNYTIGLLLPPPLTFWYSKLYFSGYHPHQHQLRYLANDVIVSPNHLTPRSSMVRIKLCVNLAGILSMKDHGGGGGGGGCLGFELVPMLAHRT